MEHMPDDILLMVLSMAPYQITLRLVCKRWYQLMKTETYKRLAYSQFSLIRAVNGGRAPLSMQCERKYVAMIPKLLSRYTTESTDVFNFLEPEIEAIQKIVDFGIKPKNIHLNIFSGYTHTLPASYFGHKRKRWVKNLVFHFIDQFIYIITRWRIKSVNLRVDIRTDNLPLHDLIRFSKTANLYTTAIKGVFSDRAFLTLRVKYKFDRKTKAPKILQEIVSGNTVEHNLV